MKVKNENVNKLNKAHVGEWSVYDAMKMELQNIERDFAKMCRQHSNTGRNIRMLFKLLKMKGL